MTFFVAGPESGADEPIPADLKNVKFFYLLAISVLQVIQIPNASTNAAV